MPIRRKTLEEFFWLRVEPNEGCWVWRGRYDGVGYGKITLYQGAKSIGAHRASWQIANRRQVPDKLHVCHSCDHKYCVNPDHLFIGTQKDNLDDASRKGRLSVPGKGWNRNKVVCARGHQYDLDNTYWYGKKRLCKKCRAINQNAYHHRNKLKEVA